MPYIRRYRKRYPKKRTYRRKTTKRTLRKNVVPRTLATVGLGLPKKMLISHKYINTSSLSIPAMTTALQTFQFTCNGMYDPNITGGGHQPLYYDQLSAIYNHYCVIGSYIKITFSTPQDDMFLALYIDDDTTINNTTIDSIGEQTQAIRTTMLSSAAKPTVLKMKWSAKKFFGGSILANDKLQGTVTSNPTEQSYYTICAQSKVLPVSGYNYTFTAEIHYTAIWYELKDLTPS